MLVRCYTCENATLLESHVVAKMSSFCQILTMLMHTNIQFHTKNKQVNAKSWWINSPTVGQPWYNFITYISVDLAHNKRWHA